MLVVVGLIDLIVAAARAFSSSFWKQMESLFGFISDADIAFLKQQVMAHPFYC